MFEFSSTSSTYEVIASFVYQPMQDPKEEQNQKRYELVNIKCASKD